MTLGLAAPMTNQPSLGPSMRRNSRLRLPGVVSPGENTSISPLRASPPTYSPNKGATCSTLATKSAAASCGVANTTSAAGQMAGWRSLTTSLVVVAATVVVVLVLAMVVAVGLVVLVVVVVQKSREIGILRAMGTTRPQMLRVFLVLMNAVAVFLRNRFEQRW